MLLLPARQVTATAVQHLLEHRKQLKQLRWNRRTGALVRQAHAQVLFHRQARKDLATLRHKAYAQARTLVGREFVDRLAIKFDAAGLDGHQAHHGLEQRRLAHAIAAQDHCDLADLGLQAYIAQDVRAAVVLVDVIDFQHA